MPKSSKSKTKCNCGDCTRCQNKKNLRIKMMMKKKTNELKMKIANQKFKGGATLGTRLSYNPETDMIEVNGFKQAGVIGDENTSNMIKTLGNVDGGFYEIDPHKTKKKLAKK